MTPASESLREASLPTVLLTTKTKTCIGTWNIRTLYKPGRIAQVSKEMKEYSLKILGLCETRWTGADRRTLEVEERSLQDVRAKRGADAASDHQLVIAVLKLKLKAYRDQADRLAHKFNVQYLKNKAKAEEYKDQVRKEELQGQYSELSQKVKRSTKQDKKNFIHELTEEAETAAAKGDMKRLYDITRTLSGKNRSTSCSVKDKDGKAITCKAKQRERWAEHFKEILNRPPPPKPPEVSDQVKLWRYQHAQAKLSRLAGEAAKTGLQINIQKTETMRINEKQANPLHLEGKNIKEVNKFTYLGSVVDKHGGTEEDIKSRTNKARFAFNSLRPIWNSSTLSIHGPRPYPTRSCGDAQIGHTLRKPPTDITRQSLEWNPQGKRKVGRPKQTWRRSMEAEIRSAGRTWTELKSDAQNRVRWRGVALALCSSGDPEA
ncbi:hypothetical protein EGW08_019734 [Elysia chlorotica]|uniref:Endonuclease/exonuclease/phosphatase domain-containing protein n=1 Tax=Elysia chlorotica TaxID=188477 RepID=A0A433STC6_ELYCH|nr:hypothetical protein EGW08_019734 [Elysia chlorotica]